MCVLEFEIMRFSILSTISSYNFVVFSESIEFTKFWWKFINQKTIKSFHITQLPIEPIDPWRNFEICSYLAVSLDPHVATINRCSVVEFEDRNIDNQ